MTAKEVIKRLESEGWYLDRTAGDHRQFKHPTKAGLVTVSGQLGKDIHKGTLGNIKRQAGWN